MSDRANEVGQRSSGATTPTAAKFESPYPPIASVPTQKGPDGIRFDFNAGCRVLLPRRQSGRWRIRIRDRNTGNILFENLNQGGLCATNKRWFVAFKLEVDVIEDGETRSIFDHDFDLQGKEVLIQFPIGTLGDIIGWFPYAARFAEEHSECRVTCALSELIIPLLQDAYPDIRLVTHEQVIEEQLMETMFATYSIGLFFSDKSCDWQPVDFRLVGLHRTAGYILGVSPDEVPPKLALTDSTRPIPDPYVCIAVQSTTGCKYWNNPEGWSKVVAFLKKSGYRVICIDQKPVHGHGLMWTHIPPGAEDETGNRPLTERARWLKHADFYIGLGSGLSWLAWAAGCPVVLISGFSHPSTEFQTPYRVVNYHACNSCWNDPEYNFDHKDFFWCPRHAGTPRHYECTRLITAEFVIGTIRKIPGFIETH